MQRGPGTTTIGPFTCRAYLVSFLPRREARAETLAGVAASDWGGSVTVVIDRDRFEHPNTRVTDTTRDLLVTAVHDGPELVLVLEDDVDVNPRLRHNLSRWPPLLDHRVGAPFFATLYNPNIAAQATPEDPATFTTTDPELVYGSQGFLLSRTTAVHVLDHWHELERPQDLRIPRLASRLGPVWVHRPSLVEHRGVPSAWGGVMHQSVDYAPDWVAPD